jgi:hypothetical protein
MANVPIRRDHVITKHAFFDRADALDRFLRAFLCACSAATRGPPRARKDGKET